MVVYTIKAVETGAGIYYVLVDKAGYPVAQGRQRMCECMKASLEYGDTREQCWERLKFWNLDLPLGETARRTPRLK